MNFRRGLAAIAVLTASASVLMSPAVATAATHRLPAGTEVASSRTTNSWEARHLVNPALSAAPSPLAGAARKLFEVGAERRHATMTTTAAPLAAVFTDANYEGLTRNASPDVSPGRLMGTVSLPLWLPSGTSNVMQLCSPTCSRATSSVYYYPNLDGNYAVSVAAGSYEEITTIHSSAGGALAVDDQNLTLTAGQPTPLTLRFPQRASVISGTLSLKDSHGTPLSVLDTTAGGTDAIGIAACPIAEEFACQTAPLVPQYFGGYTVVPTPSGNGIYHYTMSVPPGVYDVYSYYADQSNIEPDPVVGSPTQITVVANDASSYSPTLTVPGVTGTIAVSGVPTGQESFQPVIIACSAAVVSMDGCQAVDSTRAIPTTETVVLQQGATSFVLPDTGATNVALGWLYDGSLYVDSTHAVPLHDAVALNSAFVAPNLVGTVAGGTPSDVVSACSASDWGSLNCSAIDAPVASSVDPGGHYGIYSYAGSYDVFAVTGASLGPEGISSAFTSAMAPATVGLTGVTQATLTSVNPPATIAGNVTTPNSDTQILKFVVACPGALQTQVTYTYGCTQGVSEVAPVKSSYTLQAWPGTWTLYVFDQNSMLTPAFTQTLNVQAGLNRIDVTLTDPRGGVYGKVIEPKLSLALFGQYTEVQACPSAVPFAVGCAGGVSTSFNFSDPLGYVTDFFQGNGVYVLRLAPGTWRVAPIMIEGGGMEVQPPPAVVNIADGGVVRQDFAVADAKPNLSGMAYETPNGVNNLYFNVLACPATEALLVGCAGGVNEATPGRYALHLTPGTYQVQATSYDANGQVTPGAVRKIVVGNSPGYADLFASPPKLKLSGTASLVGAPPASGQDLMVLACPATVAFSTSCSGARTSTNNSMLNWDSFWFALINPGGDAAGWAVLTGAASAYNQSFPYSLPLPAGSWHVALGWLNANNQWTFASPSTVSMGGGVKSLPIQATYHS